MKFGIQTGTVTGYRSGTFLGIENAQIVQVKIENDIDATDVLLINPPGDDSAPRISDRISLFRIYNFRFAIGGMDGIKPVSGAGEKRLYSRDSSGSLAAFVQMLSSGVLKLNGDADYAVRFGALESAFNQLKSDFDLHTHPTAPSGPISTPSTAPSTADISGAKITTVRTP